MLAESEVVKQHHALLLARVPKMLESYDTLIEPRPGLSVEELGRNVRWGLERTGVAVPQEFEDENPVVELAGLTDEELNKRERDLRRRRAQLRLEIGKSTQGGGS